MFVECPPLTTPINGMKMGNMNSVSSKATLQCTEGYFNPDNVCHLGPTVTTCVADEAHADFDIKPFTCISGNKNNYHKLP